ncbi:MAG: sigma-70 family RNA polymerase sigma factor [Gemmataceae bacterium]|nr:sigma-70 family RNA polymerase sigma factor [Gemmataceae bacterium]
MADGQLGLVLRHIRRLIGTEGAPADGTDAQLLERFVATRDEAAFETLVQRYGALVLGVCRRVLRDEHATEDAFQATFVVLARKAASIRKQESIGSWLYGVAYRVAVRAKSSAQKRRTHETAVDDMTQTLPADDETDPVDRTSWNEVRTVLDEELNQLPAKDRAPLVLCYLKGRTNDEAARELHCPVGSMSWRLSQAREKLRVRLARRGVALSAAALATLLAKNAASASVPAALVRSTT